MRCRIFLGCLLVALCGCENLLEPGHSLGTAYLGTYKDAGWIAWYPRADSMPGGTLYGVCTKDSTEFTLDADSSFHLRLEVGGGSQVPNLRCSIIRSGRYEILNADFHPTSDQWSAYWKGTMAFVPSEGTSWTADFEIPDHGSVDPLNLGMQFRLPDSSGLRIACWTRGKQICY
jgi:hypothetical protein